MEWSWRSFTPKWCKKWVFGVGLEMLLEAKCPILRKRFQTAKKWYFKNPVKNPNFHHMSYIVEFGFDVKF